jgi:hypothetical protein
MHHRELAMSRRATLKRKAFFVDEKALKRAQKALGVSTESEAVRAAVQWIAEMDAFWTFMDRTRKSLPRGSFDV